MNFEKHTHDVAGSPLHTHLVPTIFYTRCATKFAHTCRAWYLLSSLLRAPLPNRKISNEFSFGDPIQTIPSISSSAIRSSGSSGSTSSIYRMTRSYEPYTEVQIAWSRQRAMVTMRNQFEGVNVELLEGSLSEAGRHQQSRHQQRQKGRHAERVAGQNDELGRKRDCRLTSSRIPINNEDREFFCRLDRAAKECTLIPA